MTFDPILITARSRIGPPAPQMFATIIATCVFPITDNLLSPLCTFPTWPGHIDYILILASRLRFDQVYHRPDRGEMDMYAYLLIFSITSSHPGGLESRPWTYIFFGRSFLSPCWWTMDTHIDFGGLEVMQLCFPELTANPTQLKQLVYSANGINQLHSCDISCG